MPVRVEMKDEPLSSYREGVRARLQELMLVENYPPGHPLVSATARHLEMSTAEEAARRYAAPSLAHFYRGCDLFYKVSAPPAAPLSPEPPGTAPPAALLPPQHKIYPPPVLPANCQALSA